MASGKYVSFEDSILSRTVRILEEQLTGDREPVWKDHSEMVNAALTMMLNDLGEDVPPPLVEHYKQLIQEAKNGRRKEGRKA